MNTEAQLEILVARYLEGNGTPEELKELEALLLHDAGNRQYFLEMVLLDQDLAMMNGSRQLKMGNGPLPVELMLQRQRRRTMKIALLTAAAAILLFSIGMWMRMAADRAAVLATFEIAPGSVFELTHAAAGKEPVGHKMSQGSRLVMDHGAVEVLLPYDVRAVVEGPAAMTLLDDRTLKLDHGRAYFKVASEEGRGFTVVTPHQRIVDLGTAFGVDLRSGREDVELHVFEGSVKVELHEGGQAEIFVAKRSVLLSGRLASKELDGPAEPFRVTLPGTVETLLHEDFESGLVGGRAYTVVTDPTVVRDLAGNNFGGITVRKPWNFQTARAVVQPVAFHDLGGEPSPGHITPRGYRVKLIQLADGADTGITCRFEGATKVELANDGETIPPAEGTPAAVLFLPSGIDLDDGLLTDDKSKSKWPIRMVFSGMNPDLRYDIALYGDRSGLASDGKERFTLNDADGAVNRSSTGIIDTFVTDMETCPNAATGHVVRWTGINPGADGEVAITVDPSFSGPDNHAYLSAFHLAVTTPEGLPVNFDGTPFDASKPLDGQQVAVDEEKVPPKELDDSEAPMIVSRYPADGSSNALPGDQLTLTFNKPIKLGTGRIFLRNLVDFTETEIAVGGARTMVNDRVLTIIPPAELADGELQMGRISGWECDPGLGLFNSSGEGMWYQQEDLRDDSKNRGMMGAMKGPNMATFGECTPGSKMRREFGVIESDSRYTVSVALGMRTEKATGKFDGCALRFLSGDQVLAEFSVTTPPGAANTVTNTGFSWNSSSLPVGVALGDPIAIEIAPSGTAGQSPGYLDLDNVRVTRMKSE